MLASAYNLQPGIITYQTPIPQQGYALLLSDEQVAGFSLEILVTWFSIMLEDSGSIPRLLGELYGRIVNLEFENLEMSVAEMYRIRS